MMFDKISIGRFAGVMYLIVLVFSVSALGIRSSVGVDNFSEGLYITSFTLDLVHMLAYLLLVWALYVYLKHINQNSALLMVISVVVAVAIMSLNMLNHYASILILSGDTYLEVFSQEQLSAFALLFQHLHEKGFLIAQIFFGLWLAPLGYLVIKSGFIPKILGILLMIGFVGYEFDFFMKFVAPEYIALTYPGLAVATIAEIWMISWLLIKGKTREIE